MALHAEEEETLESLKTWWKEQGRTLAALVIVVLAAYTGWLLWQNARAAEVDASSDLYESVLNLALMAEGEMPSEADSREIIRLSEELRAEHGDSDYARFASLFAAQQYVLLDDLESAENALRWVLENENSGLFSEADPGLRLATNLRLGRVLLAQGEPEAALEIVNSADPQGFEAGFAELRGDIYVALGREVDAREAYVAAQQSGSASESLRMKLSSLADDS